MSSGKRLKSVVISGYYGFDNLGDELILQVFIQTLTNQGVTPEQITVLSKQPEQTKAAYGVQAVNRWSPVAIFSALLNANGLVSGGGGLFQDTTSFANILYYGGLILLARFLGKPVWIWGQGIGPIQHPIARWFTSICFQQAQSVWVRDARSLRLLHELSIPHAKQGTDSVWALSLPEQKTALSKSMIGISLRPFEGLSESSLRHLAQVTAEVILSRPDSEQSREIALLAMHPSMDTPILSRFEECLVPLLEPSSLSFQYVQPSDIVTILPQCQWVLGMRFHSIILATLAGIPAVTLDYDPKVHQLRQSLNLLGVPLEEIPSLTSNAITDYVELYTSPDINTLTQSSVEGLHPVVKALTNP